MIIWKEIHISITYYYSENYTEEDLVLMKAKINFFATKVGRHPCILEFLGAVMEDEKSKHHYAKCKLLIVADVVIDSVYTIGKLSDIHVLLIA